MPLLFSWPPLLHPLSIFSHARSHGTPSPLVFHGKPKNLLLPMAVSPVGFRTIAAAADMESPLCRAHGMLDEMSQPVTPRSMQPHPTMSSTLACSMKCRSELHLDLCSPGPRCRDP
ncbi:hypothetical protein ZEAMMB73_Zm00001d005147, partial [Zea mays]